MPSITDLASSWPAALLALTGLLLASGCRSGGDEVFSYSVARPLSPGLGCTASSMTPMLRWERLESGPKPETWQVRVQADGATVFEARDLTSPECQVAKPLPAGRTCTWAVRGCAKDPQGQEAVTPWSSRTTWNRSLDTQSIHTTVGTHLPFSFTTPAPVQP
jgi:hypothetical protein